MHVFMLQSLGLQYSQALLFCNTFRLRSWCLLMIIVNLVVMQDRGLGEGAGAVAW